MQRHVALPGDIANQEGRGVLVRSCSKLHCSPNLLQGCDVGASLPALRVDVPLAACLRHQCSSAMWPDTAPAWCAGGQNESQHLAAVKAVRFALMQVRKESLDDPHIWGQVQSKSSSYL